MGMLLLAGMWARIMWLSVLYGKITLSTGVHTIEFRHEEATGGDNYYLYGNDQDKIHIRYFLRIKIIHQ
jgi:hypothetical protein